MDNGFNRKAETLGVLDEHDIRIRHVNAHLDHRGRDQCPRLAAPEPAHDGILFLRRDAPVETSSSKLSFMLGTQERRRQRVGSASSLHIVVVYWMQGPCIYRSCIIVSVSCRGPWAAAASR